MAKCWDLVVLTCLDTAQKEAFELQLEEWLLHRQCYKNIQFRIYNDEPEGCKIGAGGSTLNVLTKLYNEYGDILYTYRILLLHAGGYSQRQPNASVLGKIFAPIPRAKYGVGNDYMLDMKLEMFDGLLQRMEAGVFLASADDVEIMDLKQHNFSIQANGFVLLAHISPLHIAVDHGVYVLQNDASLKIQEKNPFMERVTRVLQKPNEDLIRNCSAIITSKHQGESCLTDSCFYFSPQVVQALVSVQQNLGVIQVEVDAYGDLLQPLGKDATKDYFGDNSRIVASGDSSQITKIRSVLYDALHDFDAIALVIPDSRFVHIGTSQELLYHFNDDQQFIQSFGLQQFANSYVIQDEKIIPLTVDCAPKSLSSASCIISTKMHSETIVPEKCFIEFCFIHKPVQLIQGCILSNCEIYSSVQFLYPLFMTVVPIHVDQCIKYVTFFCGTYDNVKKKDFVENLLFCDLKVSDVCKKFLGDSNEFGMDSDKVCLWDVPLFYAFDSAKSSISYTLSMLKMLKLVECNDLIDTSACVVGEPMTIRGIMKYKHCKTVIQYRKQFTK